MVYFDVLVMLSVLKLARPLARAAQGGKRVSKVSRVGGGSSRSLKAVYAKPSAMKRWQRMYSNGQGNGESHPPGIMTVDKWGVQREASELANETAAESEPSTHLPATEMPIFDITRGNFQETLQSRAPVIIMAYLPRYESNFHNFLLVALVSHNWVFICVLKVFPLL